MRSELFEVPILHVTVKSYGAMMVVGFLFALVLLRRLTKTAGQNPDHMTNVALYALIAGVVGARVFYIFHHFAEFKGDILSMFAVWQGGLEFVGGVILAIFVILLYLRYYKLPMLSYLDILAIGLMVGLGFGRIGCFLNGCCFGRPTNVSWISRLPRFPYESAPYCSQVRPNPARNRDKAYIDLPAEYFGYLGQDGQTWFPTDETNKYRAYLKPEKLLTDYERHEVTEGHYRCLAVHPTQLYSSLNAFILCGIIYLFWRWFGRLKPGTTFSLMLIMYWITRVFLEYIRDDNPFEYSWWAIYKGGTVSQNIGIYMIVLGSVLLVYFLRKKASEPAS
jgi:phosphatidylglycerol:prolipoprotein diacylglycerol transferase